MQCLTLVSYSDLIVCLTKETPKYFCFCIIDIANRLDTNSNCPAGPLCNTMGEPPCKKQCNIATFFQPCLIQKISNSSNEARGTSDVSDEIDRVLDGNTL